MHTSYLLSMWKARAYSEGPRFLSPSQTHVERGYSDRLAIYANVVENLEVALAQLRDFNHRSPWHMDSDASAHATGTKAHLTQRSESSSLREVRAARGESHAIHGIGNAIVTTDSGEINMTNVLYVPSLKKSLISVGAIADTGRVVLFSAERCYVLDNMSSKQVIALEYRDPVNGLYRLSTAHQVDGIENDGALWHQGTET